MTVLRVAGASLRFRPRALVAGTLCLVAALTAGVFAVGSGDYPMGPVAVLRTLAGFGDPADAFVLHELRLPRVVTGLVVGLALGLAGAVFQSLVRNPLGSPDILGFTQGASAGALTAIVLLGGGAATVATGAIAGGLVTGVVIYLLAWRGGLHSFTLVLTGVGIAAMLTGVNGYLITRAQILDAARAVLWLTGSLNGAGWEDILPLLVGLPVLLPVVFLLCSRAMTMLEMGDDAAYALGVRVERVRLAALGSAVLLVAFAAAAAGPVAFVALTAPQLARRLTGSAGPNLLASACMGAALLLVADLAAQRLFPGHQLPVGVLTGVLGGGYLVWLLATQRRAGRI